LYLVAVQKIDANHITHHHHSQMIMWSTSTPAIISFAFLPYFSTRHQFLTSSLPRSRCVATSGINSNISNEFSDIRRGKIYIQNNFITTAEVDALQKDIQQLKDSREFQPSGLSNRVLDDKNIFGTSDRLSCTITPDLFKGDWQHSYVRSFVENKLDAFRHELHDALFPQQLHVNKLSDNEVGDYLNEASLERFKLQLAEMYYSVSPKGSMLPRHQDERHEETKGRKGWIYETRRSISWIIYLNDDWGPDKESGNGGELRAFCRKCCSDAYCGSNDGDIQVGWLRGVQKN